MKPLFGIVASISLVVALTSCGSPEPPSAPALSLTGPSTITTNASTVTTNPVKVSGTATVTAGATLTGVVFTLNGGNTRTCPVSGSAFTCTAGNPATGSNTFVITATDSNGATGSATLQVSYAP